jgi:hypothetical protein
MRDFVYNVIFSAIQIKSCLLNITLYSSVITTLFYNDTQCWASHSWLKHCATSRKVAVSIRNDVIGIFHWNNPSGRAMALGSTQPVAEMSTRNIYWGGGGGKDGRCIGLTTFPPSCIDCLEIWEAYPPATRRFVQPCTGTVFCFLQVSVHFMTV